MDELTEQILAEKENVDIALHNLKTAMARNEKTVIELAHIGERERRFPPLRPAPIFQARLRLGKWVRLKSRLIIS
ncbi:MAG: hypothetical protein Q8N79_10460 [Candidatus Methanoperedens sp.]|nr:hypothetical protein [Candidatus Methanoperedens sp.]